jgi:hypothetical protein
LAEKCLKTGKDPVEFLASRVHGHVVTPEMVKSVKLYTQHIYSLGGELKVEQKVEHNADLFGTIDAIVEDGRTLHIRDLKYGKGIKVRAEENEQLMVYACMAMDETLLPPAKVTVGIIQPRINPEPDVWEISPAELEEFFADRVLPAMKEVDTAEPNPGDWCRWCPAKGVCNAQVKKAIGFGGLTAEEVVGKKEMPKLPDPDTLSPENRARLLEFADSFSAWVKGIKEDTLEGMKSGKDYPHLKLVAGRKTKYWADTLGAELELRNLLGDDALEVKLKTPAQATKLAKAKGVDIDNLIEIRQSLTVAQESDKRPAVNLETAKEAFNA